MDIKSGQYYSLGKRVFWMFALQQSVIAIALIIVDVFLIVVRQTILSHAQYFTGINLNNLSYLIIIALLIVAAFLESIGIIIAKLKYGISKIMTDDSSLRIVRGILSKEEIEIPYRRIQSVSIKQSLLYRLLGIGHVAISTTTDLEQPSSNIENESGDEVIPIMEYELAQAIADTLTNKAEIEKMQIQK
ncbi:MAG: PH domain-containing protein [Patescibacteria group bacterium]|nr:PH domain-containing protein [Patescibacteria group bacterium]